MTRAHLALIVDDDQELRAIYQELAHGLGYVTMTARDGKEALAYISALDGEDDAPDVIVLDLKMPHLRGEQFLRLQQYFTDHPSCRIVIVTAADHPRRRLEGLRYDELIEKPFDVADLEDALRITEEEV